MSWAMRTLTRLHRQLHRLSKGRLGRSFPGGAPVLWLTTPGRVTGKALTTPLLCAEDGTGGWLVAGSAGGNSHIPNWALNARAAALDQDVECWMEIAGERTRIRVVEFLDEDARITAYRQLIGKWRFFQSYAERAARIIPVFRLEPLGR
jgi:deazaflavin-dependent oxidoreductase (nitroreductase family)